VWLVGSGNSLLADFSSRNLPAAGNVRV